MTADFAVQNSLYIIAKTATAIVMGSPEGWGDHSPHPFGEPSPSRWR
uniref:40S ribosomal protein SA n=1 Tax=Siphoviridae sp. ctL5G6 TaxID=2826247 RepID=A0A8S5NA37_9CAUD|nr:MAG TPA: 40S ribosomal protein SA [Siphoviridae sp. ctL5G6]DAN14123.1 MAG TPA: 40S ribosomal protein SA [Caudoviricetes sp.]